MKKHETWNMKQETWSMNGKESIDAEYISATGNRAPLQARYLVFGCRERKEMKKTEKKKGRNYSK